MIKSRGITTILINEIDEKFKEDSMLNIIKSMVTLIVILLLALIGHLPNKIDFFINSENTTIVFFVGISNLMDQYKGLKFIFYIIIALIIIFCFFRIKIRIKNFNRKTNIITLFSFANTQFILDKGLSKKHEIELYKINSVEEMNSIKEYKELNKVILIQDNEIKRFKDKKINNESIFGFAGIGHTPLIFRAGYKIGDETYFNLFHKYRNENEFKYLCNIDNKETYEDLKISRSILKDNSDELLVILETTFEVKNHELNLLNPDSKHIIRFSLQDKGVDIIDSRTQIDEYVSLINNEVRGFIKNNNIKVVHMALSTSVTMTFALGMNMSNNYDAKTIVYHYQHGYHWGIDIFNDDMDCVVIPKNNN